MSNGVDQGVHTTHRNSDIVNLSKWRLECVEAQEIPTSSMMQTFTFGNGVVLSSSNSDPPSTRACKLHSIQSQPSKS
jgi:hypothetical protein